MVKLIVGILFMLYLLYVVLCILQSLEIVIYTEQKIELKGILIPFYYFWREFNPPKPKEEVKRVKRIVTETQK